MPGNYNEKWSRREARKYVIGECPSAEVGFLKRSTGETLEGPLLKRLKRKAQSLTVLPLFKTVLFSTLTFERFR